jgi:hypothetical protein
MNQVMAGQIELLMTAQRRFVADVSHEQSRQKE